MQIPFDFHSCILQIYAAKPKEMHNEMKANWEFAYLSSKMHLAYSFKVPDGEGDLLDSSSLV